MVTSDGGEVSKPSELVRGGATPSSPPSSFPIAREDQEFACDGEERGFAMHCMVNSKMTFSSVNQYENN